MNNPETKHAGLLLYGVPGVAKFLGLTTIPVVASCCTSRFATYATDVANTSCGAAKAHLNPTDPAAVRPEPTIHAASH
jgi:hypothetical protein